MQYTPTESQVCIFILVIIGIILGIIMHFNLNKVVGSEICILSKVFLISLCPHLVTMSRLHL